MFIKELIIEEFGAIKGLSVPLDPSLNLITGENETGKSTVCAFIKYILYGFTDSRDKERHASVKTGNSAGALIISDGERSYRISRRDSGSIREVRIFDEDTGDEIEGWAADFDTPGEYFLGISASLYTRSLYVSQTGGAALDGGSAEAVSNLLISGDEAISLKQAKKTLDTARKELKLKKGNGGRIYDCEQNALALKEKRLRGLEIKKENEAYMTELTVAEAENAALTARLTAARASLERKNARSVISHLSELKNAEYALQRNSALADELHKKNTYNGFFPDSDYASRLISVSKEVSIYEEQCKGIESKIARLRAEVTGTPPKAYDAYCELGKRDKILSEYTKNQSTLSLINIIFLSAAFIAVVSLLAIIGGALRMFSPSMQMLFTVFGISSVAAISALTVKRLPAGRIKRLLTALGADDARTPHDICKECDEYESRVASSTGYLTESLSEAKKTLDRTRKSENALLMKWNRTTSEKAIEDCRMLFGKLDQIKRECREAENTISVQRAYLSRYSEEELERYRAIGKELTDDGLADKDASEEIVHTLEEKHAASKDRIAELRLRLASSGADSTDIESIECELEAEETRIKSYTGSYEALILALDALETAEKNIRRTVSPYLSKNSGAIFSRITEGRYSQLRLDSDMNLSYLSAGAEGLTDGKYLSGGSADLAWLCLRLALHKRLSSGRPLPLILDEALVYFDDRRLELIIDELKAISEGGTQILLFSASSREKALLTTASQITLQG